MSKPDLRLKLDIDNRKRKPSVRKIRAKLRWAGYAMRVCEMRRSPSGTGWHVIVTTEPEPTGPMEIVALQAILGSDSFREASNLQRVRNLDKVGNWWGERWNVLYI